MNATPSFDNFPRCLNIYDTINNIFERKNVYIIVQTTPYKYIGKFINEILANHIV